MIDLDVRKVKKNIKILENLESSSLLDIELARKLALIECCGWIEEKMHYMICNYIDKNIKNNDLKTTAKDSIRKINFGFRYSEFKEKLIATLGEVEVIKIENCIKKKIRFNFEHFKQVLSELKSKRDSYAHTYSRIGAMITHLGFYQLYQKLDDVNEGLNIFQLFIKRRK